MTVGDMLNRVVAEFTSTHSEADMARQAVPGDAVDLMQQAMMIGKALLERETITHEKGKSQEVVPSGPPFRPRKRK